MSEISKTIGVVFNKALQEKKKSIYEISKGTGLSYSVVDNMKKGRYTGGLENLSKVFSFLGYQGLVRFEGEKLILEIKLN